jgi:hypothetical protein
MDARKVAEHTNLFRVFIADEFATFASENRHGHFWKSSYEEILTALPSAPSCLEATDRVDLYLHILRRTGDIPNVVEAEFPHAVGAYRKLAPRLDNVHDAGSDHIRLMIRFCFGFEQRCRRVR